MERAVEKNPHSPFLRFLQEFPTHLVHHLHALMNQGHGLAAAKLQRLFDMLHPDPNQRPRLSELVGLIDMFFGSS